MGRIVFCGPSTLPPGGWTFTLVTVAQIVLEAPSPPLVNYEFLEGTYAESLAFISPLLSKILATFSRFSKC